MATNATKTSGGLGIAIIDLNGCLDSSYFRSPDFVVHTQSEQVVTAVRGNPGLQESVVRFPTASTMGGSRKAGEKREKRWRGEGRMVVTTSVCW